MALCMKSLVKKALRSPAIKAYTNLPLLLVPLLTYKTTKCDCDDIDHARNQHQAAQSAMCKHFSTKIRALDHPLVSLDNATLRTTLMSVTASDGKRLFLLVDRSWSGSFSFVLPSRYRIKAQEFVEYLPKYLQQAHGDAVYRWFTTDAVAEAKEMGWDDAQQRPMSQDGIDLKADLQSMDFEWCLSSSPPSKLVSDTSGIDMDNLSLPSFQTLEDKGKISHPAGPITKVPDPTPTAALPKTPQASASVASDDLTADSTIASCLSALETNWKLILERLDTLAALGAPNPQTGPRSTSTPPVQPIPGSATTDPGTRV